jgi:putative chitinase
MMTITPEQIKAILPQCKNPKDLTAALNSVLTKYDINSTNRIAGFLSQCGHESGQFNILKENLNYSAEGLMQHFKKYFPDQATANAYARNQEKIANKVYGNRMGNGDEASGDGFRYRGRGFIQLTGKENYTAFSKACGRPLEDVPAYLETMEGAVESACWYWKNVNCNKFADADDIDGLSDIVNKGRKTVAVGDAIGFEDRKKIYLTAKKVLG